MVAGTVTEASAPTPSSNSVGIPLRREARLGSNTHSRNRAFFVGTVSSAPTSEPGTMALGGSAKARFWNPSIPPPPVIGNCAERSKTLTLPTVSEAPLRQVLVRLAERSNCSPSLAG